MKKPAIDPIRVGYSSHWKTIHPGLQHTAVGDMVLSNQFDALVGVDENGFPMPLGATSWRVSQNLKVYSFEIDTKKRFSDGSYLSSHDYKKSWLEGLTLVPKSSNSSLADVLSEVEGYEQFANTGDISGIETPDEKTLVVRFKRPFRTALDYLSGNRYAAHKTDKEGVFHGTGKYMLRQIDENRLLLVKNGFAENTKNLGPAEAVSLGTRDGLSELLNDNIDVFATGRGAHINVENLKRRGLGVLPGQDAIHEILALNELSGRFFSDRRLRQAFQYLIFNKIRSFVEMSSIEVPVPMTTDLFRLDPQPFLPLQKGRLDDDIANRLIEKGKESVEYFYEQVSKNPLIVYASETETWIVALLKQLNIPISDRSKVIEPGERFKYYYKVFEPDLMVAGFSVTNGDPDGIYHNLGTNGAIVMPMTYNRRLGELLEEGRSLTDLSEIDNFYKGFSEATLEEVPFVHLGFSKLVAIYRKDKIGVSANHRTRNEGHLDFFQRK
ncbi:MAG: hypothetical protein H6626_10830 [Pseudobdellovibrionaceae bacterium]|nr:hypothetical protein [Bdellovibrionales bacterium]USN46697.1 MAG: hypothetical protein H6626_10830 [Pseudobdellovibrionaceae bacterium]